MPTIDLGTHLAEDPLPVYELAADTYMVFGSGNAMNFANRGLTANAGFVITDQGVVLIDTLGSYRLGQRLAATIRSLSKKPVVQIVLTGLDPDRVFGLNAFPNVKVLAPADITSNPVRKNLAQKAEALVAILPDEMRSFEFPANPSLLEVSESRIAKTLTIGAFTFDVYAANENRLLVYQVDDDIVWIGDMAANGGITPLSKHGVVQDLAVLTWMKQTFADVSLIVPSKGSAETAPFAMLADTENYLLGVQTYLDQIAKVGQVTENPKRFDAWAGHRLFSSQHQINLEHAAAKLKSGP